MKETLKEFVAEKRAVSPVIGVVLMVAVVVILAAVIGAFVLGLGGDQSQAPQASFTLESDGSIIMSGGDTIDAANLYLSTDGTVSDTAVGTGDLTAGSEVASIDPATVSTVSLIYDDGTGNTATIWTADVGGGGGGGGA